MRKRRKQCQKEVFDGTRCRRPTQPNSNYCFWHEEVDGKSRFGMQFKSGEDLREAHLEGANLGAAILQKGDFRGANLKKAFLSAGDFERADFVGADLQEAQLGDANLQGAELTDANLEGAELYGANLRGTISVYANLRGAKLEDADLQEARLAHADLRGANLMGCNLRGAELTHANLKGVNLSGANLQGANLNFANLQGSNLELANLQGALLLGASFRDVCLEGCRLDGSTLKYAAKPITVKEKNRDFSQIAENHRILKNYYRSEGYYSEVSKHHYKERVFTRKADRYAGNVRSWLVNVVYELLCGYGEKPWRTVGFSFLFIFVYFLIFSILGMSIDQALLSSLLSFTTLGYGAPLTRSTPLQLVAASEALLGIFMMALLAFTFARRVER